MATSNSQKPLGQAATNGPYSEKSALLLGAGFVTQPTVDVLANSGVKVTVACRTLEKAQAIAKNNSNVKAISLDVNDDEALDAEVAKVDIVISLIPYTYHATVIKSAIRKKKNVVTTSYVSPAMMELDAAAKQAGITVMNEIGVDPGIDHLSAVLTIHEVHEAGGKILSFESYCGGLTPEPSENPLGYKFSWSPRGVLLALKNQAKFYEEGQIKEVSGTDLMAQAKPYSIAPNFAFAAYPNRDSTPYKERYHIPEAQTIIRGTLRWQGFPEHVKCLVDIGFLSEDPKDFLKKGEKRTWRDATAKIIGAKSDKDEDIVSTIASQTTFSNTEEKDRIVSGLRWIGLLSDEPITPCGNPLDTLCATLEKKMQYEEGERDFLMLQHKFVIENSDGSKVIRTSTLADYGDPKGYSAMAKLVGVPCAIAVQQVLDGTLSEKGILAPMSPEICRPLLKVLGDEYNIFFEDKTVPA